ncbi:MAG: LysR family transcriptional regulator [Oscillospiraceae bacterium]|nr:LysR family transcriptional regulator [Oscillospiraceae bacterium]
MTDKQMQYYITVCNLGSVTKAAEQLYVSRPVVSRVLRDLEEEFRTTLLIRTKNGIIMTAQGHSLKKFIESYTSSYNLLLERINLNASETIRRLRIGVSPTAVRWFFTNVHKPFTKQHKDIQMFVSELPAQDLLDALVNDEIDFAITPMIGDDSFSLGLLKIYESEIVFCSSAQSRFADSKEVFQEDIDSLPMALPPGGMEGFTYPYSNPIMSIAQMDVMKKLVGNGALYSVLPREVVNDWPNVCLIPFNPAKRFNVYLVWNEMLPQYEEYSLFTDYIQGIIKDE